MRRFCLFTVLICISLIGSQKDCLSQELSLHDALIRVRSVSPELQRLSAAMKARQASARQADVMPNPTIGTSLGNVTRELTAEQEIEYPGKRNARTKVALEDVGIATSELDAAELAIEQEVASLFYDALWGEKIIDLLQENVRVAETLLDGATRKFSQGFSGRLDVIKARVEVARAKRLERSQMADLTSVRDRLRILLRLDSHEQLQPTGDLVKPVAGITGNADSLLVRASLAHPSVQIEAHRLLQAGYRLQFAQVSSKPNFNLGIAGGIEDREPAASLNISIPLALWDTKEGAKAEAQYEQQSSRYQIERVRDEVKARILGAWQEYQSSLQATQLFDESLLKEAREGAESARKAYETTSFRFLDVIDAQRTWTETALEYYSSLRALRHAEIRLENSAGISIVRGEQ